MTEIMCRYSGDRDQAIVSYLYGDDGGFDAVERAEFDAHLASCDGCRAELGAFEDVRMSLGKWSPPEPAGLIGRQSPATRHQPPTLGEPPAARLQRSWYEIPAWAQVAAAMLCLGVGAGIANLQVRYDGNGLQVRTGWSTGGTAAAGASNPVMSAAVLDNAPWRTELTALEQRLRADLGQPSGTVAGAAAPADALNTEALRRVRALVDESERRQQRELALRLAEAVREVNAQRQADLVRIDRNIGAMQNNTGREMLRQRNEMLNYVSLRTGSQRPQ
jgi:hypothetical protein